MALIRDELIEAEARAMMRAAIEKSGWYPGLQGAARQRRIDQDVDLHWHGVGTRTASKHTLS
jgi:hypothetical protein